MKSHVEKRCSLLGLTQCRISPSILEYAKIRRAGILSYLNSSRGSVGGRSTPLSDTISVIDSVGYHESSRCLRDTYPESFITQYTSIQRTHISPSIQVYEEVIHQQVYEYTKKSYITKYTRMRRSHISPSTPEYEEVIYHQVY